MRTRRTTMKRLAKSNSRKPQIPGTSHNAQRTSIRQSCSTMLDIKSHFPVFVLDCYYVGRIPPHPTPAKSSPHCQFYQMLCQRNRAQRQWWLMPGGQKLGAQPICLCPSPHSSNLSSSPTVTFLCPFVVTENMQSCSTGTLSQCHSQM